MFFSERRRLAEQAEAEARGESFWTANLEPAVRGKLVEAFRNSCLSSQARQVDELVARLIRIDTGALSVKPIAKALTMDAPALALSYVEAIYKVLLTARVYGLEDGSPEDVQPDAFQRRVNEVFNAHRVSFKLTNGEIVPLSAEELHVEVVERTVRLLYGSPELEHAHDSYVKALREISNEDAPDAVTDAATALQETLLALGCNGNALGPLIKDCMKRGMLAPHDQLLEAGLTKFLDGVSANRSEDGDAHRRSPATLNDAWLMVHIVGALIVRLASGMPRRPSP
jgi:hypothetical protein